MVSVTCTWRVSLRPARGVLRPGSSWKSADVRVAGVWASPGALTAGGGARGGEGEEGMGGCGREQSRALSTQTACWEVGTDGGRTEHRRVGAVPGFASVPRTPPNPFYSSGKKYGENELLSSSTLHSSTSLLFSSLLFSFLTCSSLFFSVLSS